MRDIDQIRDALAEALAGGESVVLATVMSVEGSVYRGAGARMLVRANGQTMGAVSGGCLEADVVARAPDVLAAGVPELVHYDTRASDDVVLGLGLGCQGVIDLLLEPLAGEALAQAFGMYERVAKRRDVVALLTVIEEGVGFPIGTRLLLDENGQPFEGELSLAPVTAGVRREEIAPAVRIVICGGGTDAVPLARLAKSMGWHVTVIDHRAAFATPARFAGVDALVRVNLTHDAALTDHVAIDHRTMGVVMAHSAAHDRAYLHAMLAAGASYIGVLGPRRRTIELLGADIMDAGAELPLNVHSPAGLDLGAETPDEIALAIVAEIAAVSTGRSGGMLRDRPGPIHQRREVQVVAP